MEDTTHRLIHQGEPHCAVIVPADATATQRLAGVELRHRLQRACSGRVPLLTDAESGYP